MVASGLLLGEHPRVDEREISRTGLIPVNRDLDLANAPYSDSLALLRSQDWKSNLRQLSQYYVAPK